MRIGMPLAVGVIALALVVGTCHDNGRESSGGIVIQQSDSTSPEVALLADQAGSAKGSVSSGGLVVQIDLSSKTDGLSLAATAVDNESGVQAVEIWIEKRVDTCASASGLCSGGNFAAEQTPRFAFSGPTQPPGETTAASSILADILDIAGEIQQNSPAAGMTRTVVLRLSAVAVNHLGGRSQTANLELIWSESSP